MISLILFIEAAALNACMDVVSFHYEDSIFPQRFSTAKFSRGWFDPSVSWTRKYIDNNPRNGLRKWWIFDAQFTDFWHTAKSAMIVCLCGSVVTFDKENIFNPIALIVMIAIYGTSWNIWFSLFYNKILIR